MIWNKNNTQLYVNDLFDSQKGSRALSCVARESTNGVHAALGMLNGVQMHHSTHTLSMRLTGIYSNYL